MVSNGHASLAGFRGSSKLTHDNRAADCIGKVIWHTTGQRKVEQLACTDAKALSCLGNTRWQCLDDAGKPVGRPVSSRNSSTPTFFIIGSLDFVSCFCLWPFEALVKWFEVRGTTGGNSWSYGHAVRSTCSAKSLRWKQRVQIYGFVRQGRRALGKDTAGPLLCSLPGSTAELAQEINYTPVEFPFKALSP